MARTAKEHGPNPVDVHVGARVRLRRQMLRMSQSALGKSLGVTFQQVQKYERGANRIGASRLWQLCDVLKVQVQFFYEGLTGDIAVRGFADNDQTPIVNDFINSSEGVALAAAFSQITNAQLRRRIVDLARDLAKISAAASEKS